MGKRLSFHGAARTFWKSIRELSGDDGYERYLLRHAAENLDSAPLSRASWFTLEQQQKWTGVKRCC